MVTKYQKFADGYKAEAVKLYRESNHLSRRRPGIGVGDIHLANWSRKTRIMRRSRRVRRR